MSHVVAEPVDDGLVELRLTRPEARNAIDPRWVEDLAAAVRACRGARAVLITAEGPAFTVGGDLAHFAAHADALQAALAAMVPDFHAALLELAELPAPVVGAVDGACAGGGLGLVWCCDLVVASERARFACGFDRLGLSGDGGSGWWLPRLIGLRRAQQMLIGGRVLDAGEALEWGVVSEVVTADELDARARAIAAGLASGPTASLARTRALLRGASTRSLADHYAAETAAMVECAATPDAVEGIRAFAERRSPRFRGG